jgi:hypothetical protein
VLQILEHTAMGARMLKMLFALVFLASTCIAQSSSDGAFLVRHASDPNFSLTAAQMRQAEKLYHAACGMVVNEFHGSRDRQLRLTVVVGAERDEVHGKTEIWLKKWNPTVFAEGTVVLALHQLLTPELIRKLGERVEASSNATVDVAELKTQR